MFYFSPILGRAVKNELGFHVGRVHDLEVSTKEAFPRVSHVIQSRGRVKYRIPWEQIKHLDQEEVILQGTGADFPQYKENGGVLLRRDILDKQIVDINGHRVVRVNDIQLNMVGRILRLAGIDVGTPGLLRRMGLLEITQKFSHVLKLKTPLNIIPWDTVQFLGDADSPLRLTTTYKKLTRLHPADLAEILEDLSAAQRKSLFGSLDTETAAETLEHLEEDIQVSLFNALSDEVASDILEEMSPDEAADLLQDLPEERAEILLKQMEPEEAQDVKELLAYSEDTAGGFMSTEYIFASPASTCQQAMDLIRKFSPEVELVYYIYVVDEEERLLGVLSLRDIIVNSPETPLKDIMNTDLRFVSHGDNMDKVAHMVGKYDLLAIPVLDQDEILKGIVTFDDVMDYLIEE